MAFSNLYIIAEIFIALIAGACYLFYYFNSLNEQLQESNDSLTNKINAEKNRVKGLRVKLHDQANIIHDLNEELNRQNEKDNNDRKKNKKLENENNKQQLLIDKNNEKISCLEDINNSIQQNLSSVNQEVEELKEKLSKISTSTDDNFEDMYHDLRSSVALNLKNGEQALDIIIEQLNENGHIEEVKKLTELKEHYNSLSSNFGDENGEKKRLENSDDKSSIELEGD